MLLLAALSLGCPDGAKWRLCVGAEEEDASAQAGDSDLGSDLDSDEERQLMNGTHHSLFGHTGQSGLGDTGPLFGDTFPEHALAPAA